MDAREGQMTDARRSGPAKLRTVVTQGPEDDRLDLVAWVEQYVHTILRLEGIPVPPPARRSEAA